MNLELFDTCSTITNSELIKSNIVSLHLIAYYKLANGFVLIADIDKESKCDISFITKQIERIYSISSEDPKLFLLINSKGIRYDISHDIKLSELVIKYYLQVKNCDLSTIQIKTDNDFLFYLNKIAKTKKLSFEKTTKNKYYSSDSTPLFKNQHTSMSNPPGENNANLGMFGKECSPFQEDTI